MKNCIDCNTSIEVMANYCPHCGTNQHGKTVYIEKQDKPVFLIVLCTLTICGSLFTIGRACIYEFFAAIANDEGIAIRGILYIVTSLGTIAGAALMLSRKLLGLYIYSISQVIYIITVGIASLSYDEKYSLTPRGTYQISAMIVFYFGIPAIVFLVLYWMKEVRSYLK